LTKNESCEQPKICEKVFENIDEKFKVTNHRINDLENKTEEMNNINKILVELQILTKLQREDGVKRDKAIEEMNKNQEEMNKNQIEITNTLKTLADNLNQTDDNVGKLSKKIEGIVSDNAIKISTILKYIGTLVAGGILTYFGNLFINNIK
jgi:predicted RNase H-like nuclease (RuvC/YqgF family)